MTVGDISRNCEFEDEPRSGEFSRLLLTPAVLNHTRSNCHTSRFHLGQEGEALTSRESMPHATAALMVNETGCAATCSRADQALGSAPGGARPWEKATGASSRTHRAEGVETSKNQYIGHRCSRGTCWPSDQPFLRLSRVVSHLWFPGDPCDCAVYSHCRLVACPERLVKTA